MADLSKTDLERALRSLQLSAGSELVDFESGWYNLWYFELMLEQEIMRSTRHEHEFALLGLRIRRLPMEASKREKFFDALLMVVDDGLRATDLPGRLSDEAFAVILPETDQEGAQVVMDRLSSRLARFGTQVAVAMFPADALSLPGLLAAIGLDAAGKVVDIQEFRKLQRRNAEP